MSRVLQKLVHVGCRELGIDAETRRDLQRLATGKDSMSDMTETELKAVLTVLEAKGFRPHKGKRSRPLAPRADLRYVHVLWRKLGEAGALEKPGRAGLNAFIRSRFSNSWGAAVLDVDALRDAGQINDLIRALQAWCRREGSRQKHEAGRGSYLGPRSPRRCAQPPLGG